jgi:hypothetical protein
VTVVVNFYDSINFHQCRSPVHVVALETTVAGLSRPFSGISLNKRPVTSQESVSRIYGFEERSKQQLIVSDISSDPQDIRRAQNVG